MFGKHGGTWAGRGSRLVASLSGDPKTLVRRRGGLDRLHGCQLDALVVQVLEHPGAAAVEYEYEAHRDLVDESRPDRLLSDLGAADVHVLVAGGRIRLPHGALDPDGRERVDAGQRLLRFGVGDDEHRKASLARRAVRTLPRQRKNAIVAALLTYSQGVATVRRTRRGAVHTFLKDVVAR